MNLQEIADQLNKDFNFPYQAINLTSNLCDGVFIKISLQLQSEWKNGYWENSPGFSAHIFCTGQWEREFFDKYQFDISQHRIKDKEGNKVKIMAKPTFVPGDVIYKHVKNQLSKFVNL